MWPFLSCTVLTDEVTIIKELEENVVLPCLGISPNTTPSVTRWTKGEVVLATYNHSLPASTTHTSTHISILDNSSLSITGLMTLDEEVYQCETEPKGSNVLQRVQLLVTGMLECRDTKTPFVQFGAVCQASCVCFCKECDRVRNRLSRFTNLCHVACSENSHEACSNQYSPDVFLYLIIKSST